MNTGLNQDGVAVAYATVLLGSLEGSGGLGAMTATADVDEVNEVVESLVRGCGMRPHWDGRCRCLIRMI